MLCFHFKEPDPYSLAYPLFRFILREPLALPRLPGRLAQPTGRLLWIPATQEPEGKINTKAGTTLGFDRIRQRLSGGGLP